MNSKHAYNIATVFRLGYFPVAPGTVGSIAALPLCLLLHSNTPMYILIFAALFISGVISSDKVAKKEGIKDPSIVIIDEFACIFISFLFIPLNLPIVIIGFVMYRVMDILKLPPLKRFEEIKGGWGIMLDDLGAAVYTNMFLHIVLKFYSIQVAG